MANLIDGIAATLLPYWPADPGPLDEKAQSLRDLSAKLGHLADSVEDAHSASATGNIGPAIDAARESAIGPDGHAQNLAGSAADLLSHADRVQFNADFNRTMRIFIPAAVVAVAVLSFINPPAGALRLAEARLEASGLQKTFLDRFAAMFGKDEEREAASGGTQMNMARRRGGDGDAQPTRGVADPLPKAASGHTAKQRFDKEIATENTDKYPDAATLRLAREGREN